MLLVDVSNEDELYFQRKQAATNHHVNIFQLVNKSWET